MLTVDVHAQCVAYSLPIIIRIVHNDRWSIIWADSTWTIKQLKEEALKRMNLVSPDAAFPRSLAEYPP